MNQHRADAHGRRLSHYQGDRQAMPMPRCLPRGEGSDGGDKLAPPSDQGFSSNLCGLGNTARIGCCGRGHGGGKFAPPSNRPGCNRRGRKFYDPVPAVTVVQILHHRLP